MGVRHSHIPGALKVLQTKNIFRGSSEPRGIASYLFFRTAVRLQNGQLLKGGETVTNVTIVDELVSSKIVAKVLGISSRRVQQLTEDGIFEKEKRGQYNIAKTVQAFVAYKTGESKLEKKAREGGYDAERTLLTRTKRMIEENKLKIMNGELHRSNTVKAVMNRMLNNFKSKLQALPLKVAPKVLGETNLLVIQDTLLDEVNECLTELSEYDPNMFHDESDDIIVDDDEAGEGD